MSVRKTVNSLARAATAQTAAGVQQLATNPLAKPQAIEAPKVEPKKAFDPASMMLVQNLLKDTSRSTFDKLKSLLPIPESLAPIVNMFLGKGTNAGVKVG